MGTSLLYWAGKMPNFTHVANAMSSPIEVVVDCERTYIVYDNSDVGAGGKGVEFKFGYEARYEHRKIMASWVEISPNSYLAFQGDNLYLSVRNKNTGKRKTNNYKVPTDRSVIVKTDG